jgi:hypothetical protein
LDVGRYLAEACYVLEGDGYLILRGYEMLNSVEVNLRQQGATTGARCQTYIASVAGRGGEATARMRLALQPVHTYFAAKIFTKFLQSMDIMRAARYWDPRRLVDLHRAANQTEAHLAEVIAHLSALLWLDAATKQLLLAEFQSYYAAAREFGIPDGDDDFDPHFQRFFLDADHVRSFPTWCDQFFNVVLLQTSEGTVERSFSDFTNIQNANQSLRTEETLATAVKARYNARDDQ